MREPLPDAGADHARRWSRAALRWPSVMAVCATLLLTGCAAPATLLPTATFTPVPAVFEGARALDLAARFMEFGPRVTGSAESRAAGDWILQTLNDRGWADSEDAGLYKGAPIRNLAGRRGTTGPVVILGAHYDSRRRADRDSLEPDLPVPGADDGASGVAVLLELARALDFEQADRQVWLVFFDAEDNGRLDGWDWCVGSRRFAEFVRQEKERGTEFEAMVLVDMVGDADPRFPMEGYSDPALVETLWSAAADLGYADAFPRTRGMSIIDDHLPFRDLGIPSVDIIDFDYPYWHTRQDTLDKLDAGTLEMVGRTLERWLEGLAS